MFLGFFSYISLCFLFSYHWAWCHNWFVSKVFLINQCFSKVHVKNVNEGYDWWQKLRIPKINGEEVLEGVPFFSLCYSFNSSKYTEPIVSQQMNFIWKEHSDEFYPKFSHKNHHFNFTWKKNFSHINFIWNLYRAINTKLCNMHLNSLCVTWNFLPWNSYECTFTWISH